MKNRMALFLIFVLPACNFFPKDEKLLMEYKLWNGNTIEVFYINLGATSKNIIQVRKNESKKDFVVAIIEGFDDTYSINLKQIHDTLLKISFTDTTYFKGSSSDFHINLNDSASRHN